MANLASLPHISIAGAVATGTHGSGVTLGGLATSVTGLERVRADGELETIDEATTPDALEAGVVSLGLLGIVTRLTLAIEPAFRVRQQVFDDVPFDAVVADLERVATAAYSVSLFTDWRAPTFQVWLKHRVRDDGPPLPRSLLGVRAARVDRHPIPGVDPSACTVQRGVPGPWHLRLPHFRMGFTPSAGEELQSEYFVGLADGPAALRASGGAASSDRAAPPSERGPVRRGRPAVAEPGVWTGIRDDPLHLEAGLAGRPRCAPRDRGGPGPVRTETALGQALHDGPGRRPLALRAADAFADLARTHDPTGKFRNAFTDRYVFGVP